LVSAFTHFLLSVGCMYHKQLQEWTMYSH
jgi:hypothetical protein